MTDPVRVSELLPGVLTEVVDRAGHGYARWAELVAQAGYCHHPIRLAGRVEHADRQTGEVRQVYDSGREPDGVLLKACGTRRESRCPSCAATYRADAYQLLDQPRQLRDKGVVGLDLRGGALALMEEGVRLINHDHHQVAAIIRATASLRADPDDLVAPVPGVARLRQADGSGDAA